LGPEGLGLGFRGAEMAMRGVKGDRGMASGEERWGVGVMVRVERIV
jgi:hypothetical protein